MDDAAIDRLSADEVALESAKTDLKIKNRSLDNPSGPLREVVKSPAFLAAVIPTVITVCLTLAITWIDNNKANNAKLAEEERAKHDTNQAILLGVVNSGDSAQIASDLKLFLDTGLIYDETGKFKDAQAKLEDQLRQQILLNILRQGSDEPFNIEGVKMNGAFLEGFLKPIDLQTLNYFIRLGYPREMLFWLVFDSIEIDSPGKATGVRYDPPNDYGCSADDANKRCFKDYIRMMTAAGLAVETVYISSPPAGGADARPVGTVYARFCSNPTLAAGAQGAMGPQHWNETKSEFEMPVDAFHPKCGASWNPAEEAGKPQPDIFVLQYGPDTFRIVPRSPLSVFQLLGNLARLRLERKESQSPSRPDDSDAPKLWTVGAEDDLFTVIPANGFTGPCFARATFHKNDYCVPDDSVNTKRIFGLLSNLIGIQTP